MGFFKSSDERFSGVKKAAAERGLSGQTPLSWLPGFLKKGFTDSAGKPADLAAVNYSMGKVEGMLSGIGLAWATQGRWGLAAVFFGAAFGYDVYNRTRGDLIKSSRPDIEPK